MSGISRPAPEKAEVLANLLQGELVQADVAGPLQKPAKDLPVPAAGGLRLAFQPAVGLELLHELGFLGEPWIYLQNRAKVPVW
ncbi:MAG: hypothetical protein ACUVX1_14640 [Chloroflexota bacterium]